MDHQGELEAKRKHDEDEFSEGIESQDVSEEIAAVPVSMEEDDDEKGEEAEGLLLEEQILEEKESDEDVSYSLDSMTESDEEDDEEGDEEAEELLLEVPGEKRGGENISDFSDSEED
ncbi:acidic leucine-rich nuclear phosphoprotein 32 family member B-like [Anopheles moucheti]|uniref:acidic leucine-rich nuclear phosphoprotein 32 family member B-like n=1 Tax=Anopheles moucheti TaxID=186751 RepID=UPI0022F02DBA|nr:acidic leucine-rich nuclear phosphoprotein 32 family member B-like [Anopheles moucheti]XP_052900140.1 acidic leucine-rich nuclear phosphoprotein 32 family member B-like [Anopheles moucheti]